MKACNVSLSFTWFHLDVDFKRFQYVYSPWKTFENWPELKPASLKTHTIHPTSFDVICDCFGLELSFWCIHNAQICVLHSTSKKNDFSIDWWIGGLLSTARPSPSTLGENNPLSSWNVPSWPFDRDFEYNKPEEKLSR